MSDTPPCEKDFETLFGEWLKMNTEWMRRIEIRVDDIVSQNTEWMRRIETRLDDIVSQIEANRAYLIKLVETLDHFRPMIDRYEQAAKANGFRAQRAALKGKNNG